jgi:hypothetical protein
MIDEAYLSVEIGTDESNEDFATPSLKPDVGKAYLGGKILQIHPLAQGWHEVFVAVAQV